MVKGGSAKGASQELDLMYATPGGTVYPSEINPGPQGTAFGYASKTSKQDYGSSPGLRAGESATSQVMMNAGGIEDNPVYVDGKFVVSPLSGNKIATNDFTHNNMVPFFGGQVRQNVDAAANTSRLDSFTGAGTTTIAKKEVETMFNTPQTPYGNPFGMEDNTDFVQSRINTPRNRAGEKPFEPVRVAPAVGEGFGSTGKGGFQQLETNQYMMKNIKRTDDLRTADKPKLTYDRPVVPGVSFVTAGAKDTGEVRKYKPDAFFIDEAGERFVGAFAQDAQKGEARPIQIMKHQARPETSVEYVGPGAAQGFGDSYVTGSYRAPMAQQYGGAGYRNNDASSYGAGPRDDYGASAIEIRPNERNGTQDRVMGLNLAPADTGLVAVHYEDDARPTRRGETVGNIRQTGTPVGYAGGAPSITTWDPSDVARTTIKETTVDWDYRGISGPGAGPERLKVYDPNDIAKPTQKSQLSADSRIAGPAISVNKDFTSHESAYNMRKNESKTSVAKLRKPLAGNGNLAVFKGEIHQKSNRLTADDINDRALAVNRVSGMTPGAADLGRVQYRAPLKLDVSMERNMQVMVDAVENNPLNQSLRKNAIRDSMALEQLQGSR
jgi:hypothetical protein